MIYFISDLHFGHNKPFLYEPRGFNNIHDHDEYIIQKWNSIVQPEDEVYILGDLMLNDNEHGIKCLNRLMGKKYFIAGNHDTDTRIELYMENGLEWKGYSTILKYNHYIFYLSHYPTITSNFDIDKPLKARVINLCGHSHTNNCFADWDKGLIFHCELDTNNCCLWSIDEIIQKIKNKLGEK